MCSRPRKLDEVAHQDEVVQMLRRTLQSGNLPHLLMYGREWDTADTACSLQQASRRSIPLMRISLFPPSLRSARYGQDEHDSRDGARAVWT